MTNQLQQDFIRATILQFGQINREDLIREFKISPQQAYRSIAVFMASDEFPLSYNYSTKCYVVHATLRTTKDAIHHQILHALATEYLRVEQDEAPLNPSGAFIARASIRTLAAKLGVYHLFSEKLEELANAS